MYWQKEVNQNTLSERVKKLLISHEWSDCSFSLSGKKFKAHKLILSTSSPVFEAMFYGPLSTDNEVIITDIEPEVFQLLLNYIYTDEIEISCVEEAYELLYASRKYLLEHLSKISVEYIKSNISLDNVLKILNCPDYMQDKQLYSFAMKLLCGHTKYLLEENYNKMSHSCIKSLLESEEMNISERDLIKYIFKWSTSYCQQNDISATYENRRKILIENGLFRLLRFLSLSVIDLYDIVSDSDNLISPKEAKIIESFLSPTSCSNRLDLIDSFALALLLQPRKPLKLNWYPCHRSPLRSVPPVVIDINHRMAYCKMKANKSVFIKSLSVPTRLSPSANYTSSNIEAYPEHFVITILSDTDCNSNINITEFKETVKYNSLVDVELTEPCFIKKDAWYKIIYMWPEKYNFEKFTYVVECRDKIYCDHKVRFEFEDYYPMSTEVPGGFLTGLKFCF